MNFHFWTRKTIFVINCIIKGQFFIDWKVYFIVIFILKVFLGSKNQIYVLHFMYDFIIEYETFINIFVLNCVPHIYCCSLTIFNQMEKFFLLCLSFL